MFGLSELKQTRFYQEAKEEGRQEGREEGRQEGERKAKLELILRLIESGFTKEQIAKALNFSLEELKQILKEQNIKIKEK